jgi:hypothetical protein
VTPGGKLRLLRLQPKIILPASLVTLLIDFGHLTKLAGVVTVFDFHVANAQARECQARPHLWQDRDHLPSPEQDPGRGDREDPDPTSFEPAAAGPC